LEATARLVDVSLSLDISVAVVPPLLLSLLNEVIKTYETCGALRITGGDGSQLGPEDRMTVSGIVARESDVEVFDLVLLDLAEGRGIDYNLGVLNGPVCSVESLLPAPQNNGMQLEYAYGQKTGEGGSRAFRAGENPVIDLLIPDIESGYLYVFYADAEGQVYHFLPHQSRQANTLPSIGEVEGDMRRIRLTYPISEGSTAKLSLRVVGPFGTNIVVAILSQRPLFDGLRPRAESIEALREALEEKADILSDSRTMVVSRYLVTEP
jgi:hypothetical protein